MAAAHVSGSRDKGRAGEPRARAADEARVRAGRAQCRRLAVVPLLATVAATETTKGRWRSIEHSASDSIGEGRWSVVVNSFGLQLAAI